MATTTASDFQIYDALFHSARAEVLQQNVDIFNSGSNNTIQMVAAERRGDYAKESFYKDSITDNRRDPTATTDATASKLTDDEIVSVKLNRRQGPMRYTADAFKKKNQSPEQASAVLGRQSGIKQAQAMVGRIGTAVVPAIKGIGSSDLVHDGTGGSLTFKKISKGKRLFGDASSDLTAALIHGDKFHDLVEDGLDNYKIQNVAGTTIVTGDVPGAMGLVLVVTDESSLITSGTPDTYHTVLLQQGAVTVEESEDSTMADETVTGKENITREWQFEYAFNLGLRGLKWDTSNGGSNPTDSTLGTQANWNKAASDNKSLPGVVVDSD